MRYLREFFFDAIKIDGQFIDGVATDPDTQALVQALIVVGRNFEMFSVAERVSSQADAQYLIDIGVDCLQGYHFGVPTVKAPWLTADQDAKSA